MRSRSSGAWLLIPSYASRPCAKLASVNVPIPNDVESNNDHTPDTAGIANEQRPICVLGLGLIGGSLLRDLAAAGVPAFGWNRSPATVTQAAQDGFDVSNDLVDTLHRAEATNALIVAAVPVPALPNLLAAIAEHAPQCGITDVGSVKQEIFDIAADAGVLDRFIGGHPMAGTANSGWSATMLGLFNSAVWVVSHENAPAAGPQRDRWMDAWQRVVTMAGTVGAVIVPATSQAHDDAVARISHLPHVLAETLAIVGDNGGPLALSLAASSFRDGTRVAGTAPSLVRAMVENNRAAIVTALDEALSLLHEARDIIADSDRELTALTDEGFAARERFEARAGRERGAETTRPLIRVQPGASDWLEQLDAAASMGAQIEIF